MRDKGLDSLTNGVVLVDFDGVITHRSEDLRVCGKLRNLAIPSMEFLKKQGYELVIFTAREDIQPIMEFLTKHPRLKKIVARVTNVKEQADLYIDDRAYRFNGAWESSMFAIHRLLCYHRNPARNFIKGFFSDVKTFLEGFMTAKEVLGRKLKAGYLDLVREAVTVVDLDRIAAEAQANDVLPHEDLMIIMDAALKKRKALRSIHV